MKLTDTHLVILSQAAQRPALHILPTPAGLKARGGAVIQILKGLLRRGLIVEQPARGGDAVWRCDDADLPLTLVLAPAGLAAIGLEPHHHGTEALRSKHVERRVEEVQGDGAPAPADQASLSGPGRRAGTKTAAILALVERDAGASLEELMAVSGWQAHSVRGFLSATLRTKLGRPLISHKDEDGVRRYRLTV